MWGFSNILLVVVPGEDPAPAIARVARLVKRDGTALTVAMVREDLSDDARGFPADPAMEQALAELDARAARELQDWAVTAHAAGLSVTTRMLAGIAFVEVIRAVLAAGHDLVVKTAEPATGFFRTLFGSTDRHLLRKCPCPLWLADPGAGTAIGRILAAVDPDPRNPVQMALNRDVLALARSVAVLHGASLDVVHAWQVVGDRVLGPGGRTDPEVVHLVGGTLRRHQQWLDDLLRQAGIGEWDATTRLVRGFAGDVVPDEARRLGSDLIVMGTVGRIGIPGLLIGNTAERILGDVNCSVLALKPRGFVCPVLPAQGGGADSVVDQEGRLQ